MPTDTSLYRRASHQHRIEFDLGAARRFYLADVDSDGTDGGNFPVPADSDAAVIVEAFDGVTDVGTISGSVQSGGFATTLTIPKYPAAFADWFQCTILVRGWLGGLPGIPGAAGTEFGRVVLFRGYMQTVMGERAYGKDETRFPVESTSAFLKNATFSRGIDYYPGSASHTAPTTAHDIIRHLYLDHTNAYPRANYGLYFPNHDLDAFTLNEGSVFGMISSLLDNFTAGEGWLMCRRNDDLYIGTHPTLDRDNLHPSKNNPIVELDDGLVDTWEVPETPPRQVASVAVVAQLSDQTSYTATYYGGDGLGSREKRRIRTDDTAVADWLAARLYAHLNRRFRAVKATISGLPGVTVDLGDCVTATTRLPQRGIVWSSKLFCCTAISYRPNAEDGSFVTVLTLDEVLP